MTEDEIRELLREMGDQPVPAESLRRVHLAVAERTARRAWRWWWWSAAAVLAAACVVVLMVWPRQPAAVPARPAAPVVAKEQFASPKQVAPEPVPVRRPVRPVERRPVPAAAADVVIRIETPDPNVVILLIGD